MREQLQGALRKLREATESGNQEAVRDILDAVKALLGGEGKKQ